MASKSTRSSSSSSSSDKNPHEPKKPFCRCPRGQCWLHPTLPTCGMREDILPSSQYYLVIPPEFYTIEQAARLFQVRDATVRLWLRRKLLRGVKLGRDWRITREAIEEFKSGN
jgi:excisionase family DNA binding protein